MRDSIEKFNVMCDWNPPPPPPPPPKKKKKKKKKKKNNTSSQVSNLFFPKPIFPFYFCENNIETMMEWSYISTLLSL